MVLLGDPEFIVLDEPMNGLDPAGIVEVRELILSLNRDKGITFLISSHILTELSLVATKYGIISKGVLIKEISADELNKACRSTITLESPTPELLYEAIKGDFSEENISLMQNGVVVFGDAELTPILQAALNAGVTLSRVNCSKASIEEYYLSVVGGNKNA
jgi:ABC-2 type transport system ATP-binding protein